MARRRSPRIRPPQIHTTEEAAGMAVLSQIRSSEDGSGIALRRSPRLHPQIPVSGEGTAVTRRRSSRLNPQIRVAEEGTGVARRRSTRLHPQIRVAEEGAGVIRRRSPRLHPQLHTSEEVGAGVIRRRSPRLHPQVHASEEAAGVKRRRRRGGTSPAAPASLPDDGDMLREILMRLPPQPSSLPRSSAVCKRWQRVATDPRFLRSFSAHHRKPPLLGVFERDLYDIVFTPLLDPPDRIPPERFNIRHQIRGFRKANVLGCRHGRVLLMDRVWFIVWDPITGEHHCLDIPEVFIRSGNLYGAVVCAAADQGHVHGSCHSSPFKVVLMSLCQHRQDGTPPIACVYSSQTGLWGNNISATDRSELLYCNPGILVGNVLYWSSKTKSVSAGSLLNLYELTDDIIEFDLDRQTLAVIKGPQGLNYSSTHQIIRSEDGAVGLAIFSHGRFEMWQRKVSGHGGATWFLQKTVERRTVGLPPQVEGSVRGVNILGYDEDNDVMFVFVDGSICMVKVMSMQSMKLYQSSYYSYADDIHPFASFYAPGVAIPGGRDGAGMLQNT